MADRKRISQGGNAHQRATAAKRAESEQSGASRITPPNQPTAANPVARPDDSTPVIDSRHESMRPLNGAESIGLLGVLVGTLFVIIVPTVLSKLPAFLLVCFASAYFIWLSHWTYRWKRWLRIVLILLTFVLLNVGVLPQFVAQWRLEHMRSELKFDGSAPNVAYPDADHYGIKWSKDFSELRLTIKSESTAPIQNLTLSVAVIEKGEAIAGMAQPDQETSGCVVRRPRENLVPEVLLRGVDGSRANIAPFMNDMMNKGWVFRDHYDILCQRIMAGESIPLVMGTISEQRDGDMTVPPKRLHVTGDYETTAAEGSKRIRVDELVLVSIPQRWK